MNTAQDEFNKKERFVLKFIIDYHKDLLDSVDILGKSNPPFIKSQLCLAFIGADTFSRFYQILTKQEKIEPPNILERIKSFFCKKTVNYQNKKRFTDWFYNFVLNDRNGIYKDNPEKFKECTASYLWRLRCSLLHFFSFPGKKYGNYVVGTTTMITEFKTFRNQLKPNDKKKLNPKFVYYPELIGAIFGSVKNQAEELVKMIKDTPNDYISAINKCFDILQSEGAETRDLKSVLEKASNKQHK